MSIKDRIAIFIDGSNHYHIVKDMFKDKLSLNDFNLDKFIKYLIDGRKLIRTYYYSAPLDVNFDQETYVKQQKFFDKLRKMQNFKLVLCRMQKVKIDGKTIYQVKEDDIHLAVDMVKLAYNNAYDTAILVSSDGDFVPAIQAVKEVGKNVENIGFETKFSYHLKLECDKFKKLNKEIVRSFFD